MNEENKSNIILYSTEDGKTKIDLKLDNETVWLTQKQIAELFDVSISIINEHIKNIFKSNELNKNATMVKFATVLNRGFCGKVEEYLEYYNLDMILAN